MIVNRQSSLAKKVEKSSCVCSMFIKSLKKTYTKKILAPENSVSRITLMLQVSTPSLPR